MKKGWEWKKLGDICTFQRGLTYSKKDEVELSSNIVLRATNIDLRTNTLELTDLKYVNESVHVPPDKKVREGGLLVCMASGSKSHLGKVALIDKCYDFAFGGFMGQLLCREMVVPKFVYYAMTGTEYLAFIAGLSDGANINNLRFDVLATFRIPIPPLPEQQRIVGILDEAFAGLATAEANAARNLQNAQEIFDSHLHAVFSQRGEGWMETTIGDLGRVSMCKRIFKQETSATGDIPFYKIGTFGREPDAYIQSETYNQYRAKYPFPKKGDVLISAAGTIGRRVRYDGEPAYFQDSNIVWIDNDEERVLNDYLYHFYGSCQWNCTTGATISRLYNDDLRAIALAFPVSHQQQRHIVEKLDALAAETQRLTLLCEQKQAALAALKKSLLHCAFSGEL
ncbi:putative type I restriction enzyme specificity protein [Planctomycetia bacterium]|nr:putative type I restriction enzyme specificity protein [Planctomycetia bacterium]